MMTPSIRVRQARIGDAGAIAGVHVDAWRSAYPGLVPTNVLVRLSRRAQTREWSKELARQRFAESVVVAELAGAGVVGFGSCGESRSSGLPQDGEIYTLYVSPEHQNIGVGRALLLRLFEAMAAADFKSAMVWVLAQNPSRFFYEAMGGRRIAQREENLWNTVLPQAAYAWDDLETTANTRGSRLEG